MFFAVAFYKGRLFWGVFSQALTFDVWSFWGNDEICQLPLLGASTAFVVFEFFAIFLSLICGCGREAGFCPTVLVVPRVKCGPGRHHDELFLLSLFMHLYRDK